MKYVSQIFIRNIPSGDIPSVGCQLKQEFNALPVPIKFTCIPYTSSIAFLVRLYSKLILLFTVPVQIPLLNTYTFTLNTLWTEWKNGQYCSSTPQEISGIARHVTSLKLRLLCSALVCTASLLHTLKYFGLPSLRSFLPFREKGGVVPAQKQIAITTQRPAIAYSNCYRASPNQMGFDGSTGDPKKVACKANSMKGYSLGVDNVPPEI